MLWDKCECPWLGRFRGVRRVNLAKWSGNGKRVLTRSEAIDVLTEVRGAVLRGEFNPRGKLSTFALGKTTLSDLVDTFIRDYVQKRREGVKPIPS